MDSQSTDEELMIAYQQGEYAAFEILYRRHSGKVYSFLRRRLFSRDEVDDLFQKIFAKLHQSRARYDRSFAFTQWLFAIAKSVHVDWMREAGRRSDRRSDRPMEEVAETVADPMQTPEQALAAQSGTGLSEALRKIGEEERRVVEWRVFDEESYEEISRRLKISEGSARQKFSRALKRMKSLLAAERKSHGS